MEGEGGREREKERRCCPAPKSPVTLKPDPRRCQDPFWGTWHPWEFPGSSLGVPWEFFPKATSNPRCWDSKCNDSGSIRSRLYFSTAVIGQRSRTRDLLDS